MGEEGARLDEGRFGHGRWLPSHECIDAMQGLPRANETQWARIGTMLTRLHSFASTGTLQHLERFSAAMASLLAFWLPLSEPRTRLTTILSAPLADRDTKASRVIAMACGHARGSLPDAPAQDDAAEVQAYQASISALKKTLCEAAGPQVAAVGLGVDLFADPRSFVARYGMSGAEAALGDASEAQRSAWRALPAQHQSQLVGAALLASQQGDPDPVDAALEWLKWMPFPQDTEAALRFPELRAEMMIALFRVAPSLGAHHWHAARALVQGDSAELVALRSGAPALSLRHANIALQLTQLYGEFKRGSGVAALLSTADTADQRRLAAALGRETVQGFLALLDAELDEWNQGLGSRAAMKTLPDLFAADLARLKEVAESLWPSGQASTSSSSSRSSDS